jgi:magnesium transporter
MNPWEGLGNGVISKEQLLQKNVHVHEFILSKDIHAIDVQIAQLCSLVQLHPLTLEDCRKGNQRAKFERYPDYFFIVIHHFKPNLNEIDELHIVLLRHSLILIAENAPPEGHDTWRSYFNIHNQLTYADIVHNLFDHCVDSAEQRIAKLADLVSQAENLIVSDRFSPKIILSLKQHSLRFHRAVSGTFSVVREFLTASDMNIEQQILFRNIIDHQERLRYELDFFHNDLVALFDVYWGATSFHTNEQMKRLTALATIVIPLGFWTSFFGMNFETMPFKEPWFFYLALTLMSGSIVTVFIYLRRRGIVRDRQTRIKQSMFELFK